MSRRRQEKLVEIGGTIKFIFIRIDRPSHEHIPACLVVGLVQPRS